MRKSRSTKVCLTSLIRNERAAAAVEFAILSPVFILLLLGMVAYGIYFGASHSVQQISADAARTALAGLDQTERQMLARRYIDRHAAGYPFVDPKKLTVEITNGDAAGSQFTVRLKYDASDLPIWGLFTGLPLPDMTIVRNSTIRVGGI